MKKYTNGISAILAIFIFSACVAIPENPPVTPAPKSERKVSELANALAKLYRADNIDEIRDRLTNLEECILQVIEGENIFEPVLTPEELDAIVIYMVGSFQTAVRFNRFEAFKSGKLDTYYDPDTNVKEEQVIQELDWAIDDFCNGM